MEEKEEEVEKKKGREGGGGGGRGEREGGREEEESTLPLAPLFGRLNGDRKTMSRCKGLIGLILQEALPLVFLTMV